MRLSGYKSLPFRSFVFLSLTGILAVYAFLSMSSNLAEVVLSSAPHAVAWAASENAGEKISDIELHDLQLVDREGKMVNFVRDVIMNKIAIVAPFYTTCTTSFPILIYIFSKLQDMLGDRLGRDVVLVSVSVDPKTDIPIRMDAYAKRHKAKAGWIFLTGDAKNLGRILYGMRILPVPNVEEHNHIPVTVVGRAGGEWRRFDGFPAPEQILSYLKASLAFESKD
jgi:protein SCO1/2